MPKDVVMPVLGMNQDTGTLMAWLKREGEMVAEGEPLMEVETDKAVMEVEATVSGRLVGIRVAEGAEVPVGEVLAYIYEDGEAIPDDIATTSVTAASVPPPPAVTAAPPPAHSTEAFPIEPRADPGSLGTVPHAISHAVTPVRYGDRVAASPKARRLAAEHGTVLTTLRGSGPGGAVLARDVLVEVPPERPTIVGSAPTTTPVLMSAPRLERLIDASVVTAVLERLAARRDIPVLALPALLVKFAAAAARRRHLFGDDVELVVRAERHEDGTTRAAVLAGATELNLYAVAERFAEAGSDVSLQAPYLTIIDGSRGRADVLGSAAPGGATVAVGRLEPRILAVEGTPTVRPALTLSFSYDPLRIADAVAVAFFDDLVALFETPTDLLVLY